jgi:hypothetical protein
VSSAESNDGRSERDGRQRLLVCWRWHEAATPPRNYLHAAERVAKAAAAAGGELVAWGADRYCFQFDPATFRVVLRSALALLAEANTHAVGISEREVHRHVLMHGQTQCWGPGLVVAEALAGAANPGEILLDPWLAPVQAGELATLGSIPVRLGRERLSAALLLSGACPDDGYRTSSLPPGRPSRDPLASRSRSARPSDLRASAPPKPAAAARQSSAAPGPVRAASNAVPPAVSAEQWRTSRPPTGLSSIAPKKPSSTAPAARDGVHPAPPRPPPRRSAPPKPVSSPPEPGAHPSGEARRAESLGASAPPKPSVVHTPVPGTLRTGNPPQRTSSPEEELEEALVRGSVIESLRAGKADAVLELASQLRSERGRAQLAKRLEAIARLAHGEVDDGLDALQYGVSSAGDRDHAAQSRATLAYALGLAVAGRKNESLLQALDALAKARAAGDKTGESACACFLAQLARAEGEIEIAEQWQKVFDGSADPPSRSAVETG